MTSRQMFAGTQLREKPYVLLQPHEPVLMIPLPLSSKHSRQSFSLRLGDNFSRTSFCSYVGIRRFYHACLVFKI